MPSTPGEVSTGNPDLPCTKFFDDQMRSNDNDVLEYLLSDPDSPSAVDLLTFARYAQDKRVWLKTFKEDHDGQAATPEDIETWIGNWTNSQFDRLKDSSKDFFDEAARIYLADDIKVAKEEVRHETIIREVKAAGSFGRQLGIALATAILAPIIIAGVLILGAYEKYIPTPPDLVGKMSSPAKEPPKDQSKQP